MQTTVNLQEPFTYSIIPIIVISVLIIGITIYLIWSKNKRKVEKPINEKQPEIKKNEIKNIAEIKERYIKKLNAIEENYNKNKIELRQAYQQISENVRIFVYEVTDIKTQNYSLTEIKMLNIPQLYELIQEYYEPEFASKSEGDFNNSINKARRVINEWK